jgi:hypothetical protein
VTAVKVEDFKSGLRIVLYETDGRHTALRMPSTAPFLSRDRHFEEKADFIRHWWLTHRQREGQTIIGMRMVTRLGATDWRGASSRSAGQRP